MAIRHQAHRVGVFVDVQNMYHSAKKLHDGKVNFKSVLKEAVDGRVLLRARAYVVKSHETDEQDPFFDALASQGYDVRVQDLRVFSSGAKKADWDVGMAIDMVRFASRLDVVVIVSGDGDFVPLVEYLQSQGVQVEVIGFSQSTAQALIDVADQFIDLSDDRRKFILK